MESCADGIRICSDWSITAAMKTYYSENATKLVPMTDFVYLMIQELGTLKYAYDATIYQCLQAVSYQRRIKCKEPADEVVKLCKEVMRKMNHFNGG